MPSDRRPHQCSRMDDGTNDNLPYTGTVPVKLLYTTVVVPASVKWCVKKKNSHIPQDTTVLLVLYVVRTMSGTVP